MNEEIQKGYQWYSSSQVKTSFKEVCSTRDIFQARLDSMYRELLTQWKNENEIALLSAVVGELGNNCFDHNLGQWQDVSGCWFQYGIQSNMIWTVVSDRGQGVLASLKHVLPSLSDDQSALEIAFQRRISGRGKEKRGNGLKFVRSVINGDLFRGLLYFSGQGKVLLGNLSKEAQSYIETTQKGQGTFSLVLWNKRS